MEKWRVHKAPGTNQPYICDPATGKVVWLYERFHDSARGRDYLVNRITKERVWASAANENLCPAVSTAPMSSRSAPETLQVATPLNMGVGADEVVLEQPASLRRYIFNRRTGRSRWLEDGSAVPAYPPPMHRGGDVFAMKPDGRAERAARAADARAKATARTRSPKDAVVLLQRLWRGRCVRAKGGIGFGMMELGRVTREVKAAVRPGAKHDLKRLKAVVQGDGGKAALKDADQLLLEVGEYLTQRMLTADGVDSAGETVVRNKRKDTVKYLLKLIDEAEALRAKGRAKS